MKKIGKIISYILVAIILLIALLLLGNRYNFPGSVKLYVVMSGSMEPSIHTGSIAVVKPATDYKAGDIITFGPENKNTSPTTHRVYEERTGAEGEVYITKGDANSSPDTEEVLYSDVIGKVLFSVPYLGFVLSTAKQPIGFLVLIIVPALFIIFAEAKNIMREVKGMRAKKE